MGGVFDDVPGVKHEPVPGPDGFSGCGLEKPEWTKPVVTFKDSRDEHRDYRVSHCLHTIISEGRGAAEAIATLITDLTDRIDVLEMELNRLKRAKG